MHALSTLRVVSEQLWQVWRVDVLATSTHRIQLRLHFGDWRFDWRRYLEYFDPMFWIGDQRARVVRYDYPAKRGDAYVDVVLVPSGIRPFYEGVDWELAAPDLPHAARFADGTDNPDWDIELEAAEHAARRQWVHDRQVVLITRERPNAYRRRTQQFVLPDEGTPTQIAAFIHPDALGADVMNGWRVALVNRHYQSQPLDRHSFGDDDPSPPTAA